MTPLTEREQQVLDLWAEGFTEREIAHLLGIKRGTVQDTKRRIIAKGRAPQEEAA